jgi:hypothetical protein
MASKMQQKKPRKPQRFKQLLNKFTAICSHLLGGEAEDRLYELALAGQTASHKSTKIFGLGCKLQKSTNQTDQVADGTTLGPKLGGAAQIAATVQGVTAGMALLAISQRTTKSAFKAIGRNGFR